MAVLHGIAIHPISPWRLSIELPTLQGGEKQHAPHKFSLRKQHNNTPINQLFLQKGGVRNDRSTRFTSQPNTTGQASSLISGIVSQNVVLPA